MAKTGESQTGSVSFLSYWRIIFEKFCDNLKEESTFKLYYISGDFLFINSAIFIHSPYQTGSQPMSGR